IRHSPSKLGPGGECMSNPLHWCGMPRCSRCGIRVRRLASDATHKGATKAGIPNPRTSLRVSCAPTASTTAKSTGGSTMKDGVNRQILLVEKPTGKLAPQHFKMTEASIPEPADGEALVRVRYISLDAANRAWMHGATYRAAVEANSVMAGGGIAEVVSSRAPELAPGDIVFGD